MTARSRKTRQYCQQFLRFFKKRSLTVNFSKLKIFTALPIDVVEFNCREIGQTGNRRVIYPTKIKAKFRLPLKLWLLRGSRLKSA